MNTCQFDRVARLDKFLFLVVYYSRRRGVKEKKKSKIPLLILESGLPEGHLVLYNAVNFVNLINGFVGADTLAINRGESGNNERNREARKVELVVRSRSVITPV